MIETDRLDAGAPGQVQASRIRTIGDHDRDSRIEAPITGRVDQRLEIAASTRNENAQPTVHSTFT
jgi:hypothetical protein